MMCGFGGTDVQCSSEEEVGAAAAQCRSLPGVLVDEVSFVSPNEECEAADGAPSWFIINGQKTPRDSSSVFFFSPVAIISSAALSWKGMLFLKKKKKCATWSHKLKCWEINFMCVKFPHAAVGPALQPAESDCAPLFAKWDWGSDLRRATYSSSLLLGEERRTRLSTVFFPQQKKSSTIRSDGLEKQLELPWRSGRQSAAEATADGGRRADRCCPQNSPIKLTRAGWA